MQRSSSGLFIRLEIDGGAAVSHAAREYHLHKGDRGGFAGIARMSHAQIGDSRRIGQDVGVGPVKGQLQAILLCPEQLREPAAVCSRLIGSFCEKSELRYRPTSPKTTSPIFRSPQSAKKRSKKRSYIRGERQYRGFSYSRVSGCIRETEACTR